MSMLKRQSPIHSVHKKIGRYLKRVEL